MGLGTYKLKNKKAIVDAITKVGYRHIDTAYFYENEDIVGEALKEVFSSKEIKREDLFISTKMWPIQFADPETAIKLSLRKLGIDYVDLYIIHWPSSFFDCEVRIPLMEIWRNLEKLVDKGYAKALGVSNFCVQLTADLLTYAIHKPVVNQIELHPYNSQPELIRFLEDYHIVPVGYCPLARPAFDTYATNKSKSKIPDLREDKKIQDIAKKHNKTEYQVVLRWGLDRKCALVPKAETLEHQKENLDVFDFTLDKEDHDYIDNIDANYRICNKYPFLNGYDIFA